MLRRTFQRLGRLQAEGCVGGLAVTGQSCRLWLVEGHICTLCLVEGSDGVVLVDGGFRGDDTVVEKFVRENGLGKVQAVVCTHAHPDHCMAMGGSVKSYAPNGIQSWYGGAGGKFQMLIDYSLGVAVGCFKGKGLRIPFGTPGYAAATRLQHGESLRENSDWVAVSIPGHTDHMLGLYNKTNKILYASDLFVVVGDNKVLPPIPVDYPEVYKEVGENLASLDVDAVVLAHGGVLVMREEGSWAKFVRDLTNVPLQRKDQPAKKESPFVSLVNTNLVGWNQPGPPKVLPKSEYSALTSSAPTTTHSAPTFTRYDLPSPPKLPPLQWFATFFAFTAAIGCFLTCILCAVYFSARLLVMPFEA